MCLPSPKTKDDKFIFHTKKKLYDNLGGTLLLFGYLRDKNIATILHIHSTREKKNNSKQKKKQNYKK